MDIILPEIVAAGIYNTEIAVKNKTVTKNRKTTMFEIEMPIENGGTSFIDTENQQISTNMIICAKPGQIRHTKLPYKCRYIHMILKEGMLYNMLMNMPNFIKITNTEKYNTLFKKLCSYYETNVDNDKIILQSLILELVYKLNNTASMYRHSHKTKSNNYAAVEKTMHYIKSNLTLDLSLAVISEYVSFSPIYLHNLFKASTGKTIHEYVEEQRLKKAINLLTITNLTLTKIAYECGFSSQAYFSYVFKRKMKIPPKMYTKKIIERYDIDNM